MQPVKSSTISHVGHDPDLNRLTIKFNSGGTYTYDGVSAEEHKALLEAPSIGKHFAANIRQKYKGVRQ
jgi:hypothetical protein